MQYQSPQQSASAVVTVKRDTDLVIPPVLRLQLVQLTVTAVCAAKRQSELIYWDNIRLLIPPSSRSLG